MIHSQFKIGLEFYSRGTKAKWRCTDVGSRVIVAIQLNKEDESWYNGPPYPVVESVWDENDIKDAVLNLE